MPIIDRRYLLLEGIQPFPDLPNLIDRGCGSDSRLRPVRQSFRTYFDLHRIEQALHEQIVHVNADRLFVEREQAGLLHLGHNFPEDRELLCHQASEEDRPTLLQEVEKMLTRSSSGHAS